MFYHHIAQLRAWFEKVTTLAIVKEYTYDRFVGFPIPHIFVGGFVHTLKVYH
jgi:hypothetical protein